MSRFPQHCRGQLPRLHKATSGNTRDRGSADRNRNRGEVGNNGDHINDPRDSPHRPSHGAVGGLRRARFYLGETEIRQFGVNSMVVELLSAEGRQ